MSTTTRKRWPKWLPKWNIEWLVNRYHVSASDETIAEDIRRRAKNANMTTRQAETCAAYAIHHHHHNQGFYSDVMSGNLSRRPRK